MRRAEAIRQYPQSLADKPTAEETVADASPDQRAARFKDFNEAFDRHRRLEAVLGAPR
jgi:hypothetical protein